jgi:predicted glycosyltransferase
MSAKHKRILFHAINGHGLGHIVRLSVIAHALKDYADIAFYTNSRVADRYCPGQIFTDDGKPRTDPNYGFSLALAKYSPHIVVCDTHWPPEIIRQLREGRIHSVLILRALAEGAMESSIRWATEEFSSVLIPHHPVELASLYQSVPELLQAMTVAPFTCIGPVARTTAHRDAERSVIFTLGGGGEYWNWTQANSVDTFIHEYRSVATMLKEKFGVESVFAAGPLLDRPDDSLFPFKVLRSPHLHQMFGPNTIVVTRGGYNTCWEAVAAGARLVIVGSHADAPDIAARGHFLAAEGLARHVGADATEILEACTDLIECPAPNPDHYLRRSVNGGLSVARDAILGPTDLLDYSRGAFWVLRELKTNAQQ